jgi:hypothetical protein
MMNDPTIVDLSFPMDGMLVTLIDPWYVNAYGTSFVGTTIAEVLHKAGDYAIEHRLRPMLCFPFQIKEPCDG